MARGGYRKPANPAPVSGPGKLSRRTDGGPVQGMKEMAANGVYGERKALAEMQSSAPMQGNPVPNMPTPTVSAAQAAPTQQPMAGLFDPTQRPSEPITAGMPFGDGSNYPTAMPVQFDDTAAQIRAAYALYPNESLRMLLNALENEGR
jgi:hypothetical protein